jgi:hypothetical protein
LTSQYETGSFRERLEKHDYQRTLALTVWGTWHYGIPQKYWYMSLDRFFGKGKPMQKMILDVYPWVSLHLIPSFYIITGVLKNHPNLQVNPVVPPLQDLKLHGARRVDPEATVASLIQDGIEHLKSDWFEASFGSALFWTPLVYANFKWVPQHSRIMTVVTASFLHKTWLSWLAHRDDKNTSEGPNFIELAHENVVKDATTISAQTRKFAGIAGSAAAGVAGTGLMLATTGGGRRAVGLRWLGYNNQNPRTIPSVRCFVDVHRDQIPTHSDLSAPGVPVARR